MARDQFIWRLSLFTAHALQALDSDGVSNANMIALDGDVDQRPTNTISFEFDLFFILSSSATGNLLLVARLLMLM